MSQFKIFALCFIITGIISAQSKVIDHINATGDKVIGYNYYDHLTGGAAGESLIRFSDGTMVFGSMAAVDEQLSTRGSYYNYFNGSEWLDTAFVWKRIEQQKRGWTQIAAADNKDNTVYMISHAGLELSTNSGTLNDPSWTKLIIPGTIEYSWPKIAADYNEVTEKPVIYLTAGKAEPNAGLLMKSGDNSETWGPQRFLVDTTSLEWKKGLINFSADNISIAARKGKAAVLNFPANGNVTLFVSSDYGETFTQKTIFRVTDIDTEGDAIDFDSTISLESYVLTGYAFPDGTADVHIDLNGKIHCAWGNRELGYMLLLDEQKKPIRDSLGRLQRRFFITDWSTKGISYWNSDMSEPVQAVHPDQVMMGTSLRRFDQDGVPHVLNDHLDRAIIGMPSLASDQYGSVHMVFQGFNADDFGNVDPQDTLRLPCNHAYVAATHNGYEWTSPTDVFSDIRGLDMNHPVLADLVDGDVHMAYQIDETPGSFLLTPGHPANKNYFLHHKIEHIVNNTESDGTAPGSFSLSEAYPNPFNPAGTRLNYEIPENSRVIVELYNSLGELISTVKNEIENKGKHHLTVDFSGYSSGVYFCRVTAVSSAQVNSMSRKLIFMK